MAHIESAWLALETSTNAIGGDNVEKASMRLDSGKIAGGQLDNLFCDSALRRGQIRQAIQ